METGQNRALQQVSRPAETNVKRSAEHFIVVTLANLAVSAAVFMTFSALMLENWLNRRRVMDHKQ